MSVIAKPLLLENVTHTRDFRYVNGNQDEESSPSIERKSCVEAIRADSGTRSGNTLFGGCEGEGSGPRRDRAGHNVVNLPRFRRDEGENREEHQGTL